jgi:hypothetical protein
MDRLKRFAWQTVQRVAFACACVGIFMVPLSLLFVYIDPHLFSRFLVNAMVGLYAGWVFWRLQAGASGKNMRHFSLLLTLILLELLSSTIMRAGFAAHLDRVGYVSLFGFCCLCFASLYISLNGLLNWMLAIE